MIDFRSLRRDERGATIIETAIALPVLVSFIWGIFQFGVLFQANSGMQHALGEGSRLATIWPTPTDAEIQERMNAAVFGTGNGNFTILPPENHPDHKVLTVQYSMPMNFLFFEGPTVNLASSKKVYIDTTNSGAEE